MMNCILGFNQENLLKLCEMKSEELGEGLSIKVEDLLILRWFSDKFCLFEKRVQDEDIYARIDNEEMLRDIPILHLSMRGLSNELAKLCELDILKKVVGKKKGREVYYGFGGAYKSIINFSHEVNASLYCCEMKATEDKSEEKKSERELLNEKYGEWFEKLYSMYPRKSGKIKCKQVFIRKVRSKTEETSKEIAIKIYKSLKVQMLKWAAENDGNGRLMEYYPFMSSWLNANFEDMK